MVTGVIGKDLLAITLPDQLKRKWGQRHTVGMAILRPCARQAPKLVDSPRRVKEKRCSTSSVNNPRLANVRIMNSFGLQRRENVKPNGPWPSESDAPEAIVFRISLEGCQTWRTPYASTQESSLDSQYPADKRA